MAIKFGGRPIWRSTVETINSKVFTDIVKDAFGYTDIHRRRMDTAILQDNAPVRCSKENTASLSACGLRIISYANLVSLPTQACGRRDKSRHEAGRACRRDVDDDDDDDDDDDVDDDEVSSGGKFCEPLKLEVEYMASVI
ncbi:hypothetical protein SprV_0602107200 [Sparganum proliferum]